jgi:hypothetical protein
MKNDFLDIFDFMWGNRVDSVVYNKDDQMMLVIPVPGATIDELKVLDKDDEISVEYIPTPNFPEEGWKPVTNINNQVGFQRRAFRNGWKKTGVKVSRVVLSNGLLKIYFIKREEETSGKSLSITVEN